MKTLLILRHAKSSWDDSSLPDHDRPLNDRGRRTAPLMGGLIGEEGIVPDLILSSTACRARETAHHAAEHSGYNRAVELCPDLYPTSPTSCIDVLADLADEIGCVMIVGHNPGLENLVELLTGEYERLPTAALAQLSLDIDDWPELSHDTQATLVNLWRPRELF